MRRPTIDSGQRFPFLAHFSVPLDAHPLDASRYDRRRMLLMVGDVPAVLLGGPLKGDRTLRTRVNNETTDDR